MTIITGGGDDLVKGQGMGSLAPEGGPRERKQKKKWVHDIRGTPNMDRKNVQIGMMTIP